jgi:hypothetical protein
MATQYDRFFALQEEREMAHVVIDLDDVHHAFAQLVRALGGRAIAREYVAQLALVARTEGGGR